MDIQTIHKVSPKDVFLHLLSMVTLYTSAVTFLMLIFDYINLLLPDALQTGYVGAFDALYHGIRLEVATLIVVFPTYIIVSWILQKVYTVNPEKRDLRIRKWLLYLTLFIAGLVFLGDLVTLIYNFLEGDITLKFILKVVSVLFVTGSIFFYYLADIRKHNTE